MISPKTHLFLLAAATALVIPACQSVQDARMTGLKKRQDAIDSNTSARQARWKERAEREDARGDAFFDSM